MDRTGNEQNPSSMRPRATMRGSLAVAGLIAATLTQALLPPGARAEVTHTVIAATGTAAPEDGLFLFFPTLGMNARGEVVFDAFLAGTSRPTGIFVWDGRTTSAIARGPDPMSGIFGFVQSPAIGAGGEVVFVVAGNTGIFRDDGIGISPIVQEGDPAPGGGNFTGLSFYSANSRGVIAFPADVTGGASISGIFRSDGTRTVSIARDNTISPLGGTFVFFGESVINRQGQVAYYAGMTGGSGDFGIFRGDGDDDGETNTTIFAANQPAPGGGTFVDFGVPIINARGQVAALGLTDRQGLFRGDGKRAAVIALQGDPAPNGGNYDGSFFGPQVMNDRGQVAFNAGLSGGASDTGIFRGDGVTTSTIALAGTTAPGTTGIFSAFGDMKIGENGTVAFMATLALGVGGVDGTNNMGIWSGTSDSDLHLLVRTSDIIDGSTLISLPMQIFAMNERGVAWQGRFSGPSSAIVFSTNLQEEEGE
jgi:hypothetical protein